MDALDTQLAKIEEHLAWVKTEPFDWKLLVQAFTWTVCGWELYLLFRQLPNYSKKKPPKELAAHVNDEEFAKSQDYGRDKAYFGILSTIYKQTIDSAFLHYGVYAYSWALAEKILVHFGYSTEYEIAHSNLFVFVLYFISTIPTVPLSLYQTFVIEEKHGFNKMSLSLFIADMLKGILLMVAIGGPFLSAFLWVFKWAGDRFLPWLMAFLFGFQIIMVVLYPTVIQPLFNKLSPLREGDLRTRTESLASKLRFPLKHLYEIDGSKRSSHSNAYFFGLPWSKHIVIYDTLIKESSSEEVEAVLAHELGHWYFSHPTKMLLISQVHLFAVLAVFPAFLHSPQLLRSFDFGPSVAAKPPTVLAFLLFMMLLTPVDTAYNAVINALSRHFEWQADRFACELSAQLSEPAMDDMGTRLGRALTTLHVKNLSTMWVDWLYSAYHHSHPTLIERLHAIENFQTEKAKRITDKKEL